MPPKKSVSGWTPYNITFQRPDGTEGTWLRYAPNVWKAATDGRAALVREYGESVKLVKIAPYHKPEPPKPEGGNPFKVGDILEYSWGYDQTNADFYQVVRTTAKSVVIRQVDDAPEETGFMCGKTVPVPGKWARGSKEQTKRVKFVSYPGHSYYCVQMPHGQAEKWDGKPARFSTYA